MKIQSKVFSIIDNIKIYSEAPIDKIILSSLGSQTIYKSLSQNRNSLLNKNIDVLEKMIPRKFVEEIVKRDLIFDSDDLQKFTGKLLPLPKKIGFLDTKLAENATQIIKKLLFGCSPTLEIAEILNGGSYTTSDYRYRSDYVDGVRTIFGENTNTLKSLSGISHELGHCLYENLNGDSGIENQILSESFAMSLENYVVSQYLSSSILLKNWEQYQAVIDKINYSLFLKEVTDICTEFNDLTEFGFTSFESKFLAVRETYFTSIGYQYVYAAASDLRSKLKLGLLANNGIRKG